LVGGQHGRGWRELMRGAGSVVCRRCSRAAFIGRGQLAGVTEERSRRQWVLNLLVSTLIRGGESLGHRASAGEGRRPGGGSIQLHPSAGGGWTVAHGVAATDRTAMAARTLSDEGDDPGFTDRVSPPVSDGRIGQAERRPNQTSEAMAESNKQSNGQIRQVARGRRWAESDKRSRPVESDKRSDGRIGQVARGRRWADWAGQGGRRWATAGLEKKRGGRAKTISRAEIK
jgi:hypothetical protein